MKSQKTVRNNLRNSLKNSEWEFKGYLAKYIGWIIIIAGFIAGIYRYFTAGYYLIEFLALIIISSILGGLFLLISWMYLPEKN
jgi:hypothetical protein